MLLDAEALGENLDLDEDDNVWDRWSGAYPTQIIWVDSNYMSFFFNFGQVPLLSIERVELEERRGRLTLLIVSR